MNKKAYFGRRLGNSIPITLYLRTTSLDGQIGEYAVSVALINETKGKRVLIPCSVDGNEVHLEFTPAQQMEAGGTGIYTPVIILANGDEIAGVRDWYRSIEIVAHTSQEYSLESEDADVIAGAVILEGSMEIAARGLSSYEVWCSEGNTGTVQDYLDWLRWPATEIAEQVVRAEQQRISEETARSAAEIRREDAEIARATQARYDHGIAASDHETAETDHRQADTDHGTALSDHALYEADHAVMQRYDDRLGIVEEDASALALKMGSGVTFAETKQAVTAESGYVNAITGEITESGSTKHVEVELGTAKKVRFLGMCTKNYGTSGYAFGYYADGTWVTLLSSAWDLDTALSAAIEKEYVVDIPEGATHFRTTEASPSMLPSLEEDFYLYLLSGDSVSDLHGEVVGAEVLQEYPIAYSSLSTISRYINVSSKWASSDYGRCKLIPVVPGRRYKVKCISVSAKRNGCMAMLKDNTTTGGTNANYAQGWSKYLDIPANREVILTAPVDAAYLYILTNHGATVSDEYKITYEVSQYAYKHQDGLVDRMKNDVDGALGDDVTFAATQLHPMFIEGFYVAAEDGSIQASSADAKYVEVELNYAKRVRFLGVLPIVSTWPSGYAFGYYDEDVWVTVSSFGWDYDTTQVMASVIDIVKDVPAGATHFRTTIANTSGVPEHAVDFYLYLLSGDTVSDLLAETVKQDDVIQPLGWKAIKGDKATSAAMAADIALDDDYDVYSYDRETLEGMSSYYANIAISVSDTVQYGANYRAIPLYVEPGDIVQITANGSYYARACWLTCAKVPNNGSGASKYSSLSLSVDTTTFFVAPNVVAYCKAPADAHVLLLYRGHATSSPNYYVPANVTICRKKQQFINTGRQVPVMECNARITSGNAFAVTSYGAALFVKKGYRYTLHITFDGAATTTIYTNYLGRLPGNEGNNYISGGSEAHDASEISLRIAPANDSFYLLGTSREIISMEAWEFSGEDDLRYYGLRGAVYDLAAHLEYKEVDLSTYTLRNYAVLAMGIYGASANYKHVLIPVKAGDFIKVMSSQEHYSSNSLSWLTSNDTPVANGPLPLVGHTATIASYLAQGTPLLLRVPDGANYLCVYLGQNNAFKPDYIGIAQAGSATNAADDQMQTLRHLVDTRSNAHGLIPLTHDVDSNGWELPTTVQQLNTIKKALQMCRIKWTPKADLPGKKVESGVYIEVPDYHKAGVQQTGIPYSGNWHDYKYVGIEVSIHTFMTAVNNPYSLVYTEDIFNKNSRSAWGKTYYNTNGWMYYGTVCCGFTAGVNGQYTKYGNTVIPKNAEGMGNFVRLWNDRDFNMLKIGDVYDNDSHSFLVFGLHRDANGDVDKVRIAESTSGNVNSCHTVDYPLSSFTDYINRSGNRFYAYRVADLYKNVNYEPSPYVPLTDYGENAETVVYNDDICCFAGDKATFMKGDRIAVNYNLNDSPTHEWTAMEIYKGDVLLQTVTLADIDQSALHESQRYHAVDLGTTLAKGQYKARMTDGANYSDYTYWEVLGDTVTAQDMGDGSYLITNSSGHTVRYIYMGWTDGTYFRNNAGREPVWTESISNKFRIYFDKMLSDWGYDPSTRGHIRVMLQGSYGMAATAPILLPGRPDNTPVEPEEDEQQNDDI